MKYQKKRRFGALVLALAMALSLAAPAQAVAADNVALTVNVTAGGGKNPAALKEGDEITLTATVTAVPDLPAGAAFTYTWPSSTGDLTVTPDGSSPNTATVKVNKAGSHTINVSVTAQWHDADDTANPSSTVNKTASGSCALTAAASTANPAVTGVELNKKTLTLTVGSSETLTAAVLPAGASQSVTWSPGSGPVVKVDSSGKVTAVAAGEATVTATAGSFSDSCTVTVTIPSADGVSFVNPTTMIRGLNDSKSWDMSVSLSPAGAEMKGVVRWRVEARNGTGSDGLPKLSSDETGTTTVEMSGGEPGEYTLFAQYFVDGTAVGGEVSRNVTISGIILNYEEVDMQVGGSRVLAVDKAYGYAASGSPSDVVWTSSDYTVISPMHGDLMAWNLGSAIITANKNGYTAECRVTVKEDEDVIAGPYGVTNGPHTVSTGTPLVLGEPQIYSDLDGISRKKTETIGADGSVTGASPLSYITNVKVPTEQGTLYYNYNSDANTGAGVGSTDRFGRNSYGSVLGLDMLYFVPRQGFSGTAEISFTGIAQNSANFSGVIRVEVTGIDHISYRVNAGEPVNFLDGDFNTFCRTQTGRDLNYVTFNLPQTSQGTLYYNYTSPGQFGDRVSTSSQYGRSGRYLINDVSFVSNDAFTGDVRISFRGVDTAGKAFNGEVVVTVAPANAEGETANVYITGQRGQPVALQSNLFNYACQATIRDTLSYVTFTLPNFGEGTLYFNYRGAGNYDSRVSASARCYYSGVPGISSVTFVPAASNTGRVAVPYTGYGVGGTTFTGTLYISIVDTDRSTIRYFVPKNGTLNFNASDFNNAALLQTGHSVDYVEFQGTENIGLGASLYYDYNASNWYNIGVYSNYGYYRNPNESYRSDLNRISFHAKALVGSITIPYTAYSTATDANGVQESFKGAVVIQVGAPTPADVNLSVISSGQVWLSGYTLSSVCGPVMNGGLSYIEITSLPPAEEGRLYYGYAGFNEGTQVKPGDRFYCLGSPNIDQVSFIPHGGFEGTTELTYVGYSSDGQEQVSGRIFVKVTKSSASRYFKDLTHHTWAVDAADFLCQNGTMIGVGENKFAPTLYITKGDLTLMLVRTFGFTANGAVSYYDVPADSYYAQAISIASQLGIVSGSNGYFNPKENLTRQDAMLMICNALAANGWTLTNGLAADFSKFYDEKQIAGYARAAVGSLMQMGVVQGDGNGYLNPASRLTRAEMAMMMHAVMTL